LFWGDDFRVLLTPRENGKKRGKKGKALFPEDQI